VQRGEIWAYRPALPRPGQSLLRLILSAPGVNDNPALPVVIGAQVLDHDPGGLLSVRLEGHGWLSLLTIEAVLRSRLDAHVGTASAAEMEAVEVALAAMLDMR
jgi:mRNA-degrading endonuclease toxin of MazEF toxin-antitoxin module